ncbi:protein-L-isoaspartate O-methyltransferase family protein [Blastochloris sulfoviridis]|uniref:Protein-L-isoaspartate O-methyltransferase n=1 Tax=Blastochloris sulfoviridis TaxID=50712 RepID=A0A5M6I1H7_9HYPH|nr:protein-L-isoaspartate O-methyltransferase [Blastochloris sulfoviridis]KAA5602022.1 protein-L-isoaspartate O-methyltransferase [Blastochloris sulfoviridis]
MIDFVTLRRNMVNGQVRTNGVTDPALIAALLEIPREAFVPESQRALAYRDDDLPIGGVGPRYLLEPLTLARMIQALGLQPGDRVLDVGCGSGYSAALVARLAQSVVALEADPVLSGDAVRLLDRLAIGNAAVASGPLAAGWPKAAPFDAILLEGAVEQVPQALFGQLKDNGRLIAVVGCGGSGRAVLYRSLGGTISSQALFNAAIPALPGFEKPKGFAF